MINIYQTYKKLLSFFKPSSEKPVKENQFNIGNLLFKFTDSLDVNITCEIPSVETLSLEEIGELSEKYAELIVYVNNGLFKEEILKILKNNAKKTDDPKEILYINNVITFCDIIHNELIKVKSKLKGDQPLIRPSSVFKNS
jgi:hypothetical protein